MYFNHWKNSKKQYSKLAIATLKILVKNLKINHILVLQKSFQKLRSLEAPIAGSGSTKVMPTKKVYKYDENTSFNVNVS